MPRVGDGINGLYLLFSLYNDVYVYERLNIH